jgi:hypothetical protein
VTIHPDTTNRRPLILGSLVAAASLALLACPALAQAAPNPASPGSVQAHVAVSSAITLSGLPVGFLLSGIPTDTVATGGVNQDGPVTMTVWTNNTQGYTVTVQAVGALTGAVAGNTDTIPASALRVRESGSSAGYQAVSATNAVTVYSKDTPSSVVGDALSNDYSLTIPFVAQDTYTTTLNYIATTN